MCVVSLVNFDFYFVYLYSHFQAVLETAQDPRQRTWLLRRIRESHQEYLTLMEEQRLRIERENSNMEAALTKIRALEARKKE
jgi:hypothetical protein